MANHTQNNVDIEFHSDLEKKLRLQIEQGAASVAKSLERDLHRFPNFDGVFLVIADPSGGVDANPYRLPAVTINWSDLPFEELSDRMTRSIARMLFVANRSAFGMLLDSVLVLAWRIGPNVAPCHTTNAKGESLWEAKLSVVLDWVPKRYIPKPNGGVIANGIKSKGPNDVNVFRTESREPCEEYSIAKITAAVEKLAEDSRKNGKPLAMPVAPGEPVPEHPPLYHCTERWITREELPTYVVTRAEMAGFYGTKGLTEEDETASHQRRLEAKRARAASNDAYNKCFAAAVDNTPHTYHHAYGGRRIARAFAAPAEHSTIRTLMRSPQEHMRHPCSNDDESDL